LIANNNSLFSKWITELFLTTYFINKYLIIYFELKFRPLPIN
jgi:hypothetical protein